MQHLDYVSQACFETLVNTAEFIGENWDREIILELWRQTLIQVVH